jgi:hypothetical protein
MVWHPCLNQLSMIMAAIIEDIDPPGLTMGSDVAQQPLLHEQRLLVHFFLL